APGSSPWQVGFYRKPCRCKKQDFRNRPDEQRSRKACIMMAVDRTKGMKAGAFMRILRCEARRVRGYWVAECLELSLSVKASSLERAKRALNAALAEHHLLSRRQAPRG